MPDYARSTIVRLAALYGLGFALTALVLGSVIYSATRAEIRHGLEQRVLGERDALARETGMESKALERSVNARLLNGGQDMFYALADARGRTIAGSHVDRVPSAGWSEARFLDADQHYDHMRALVTPVPGGMALIVGAEAESIERLDERILPLFTLVFGMITLLGIGGGLLLSMALRRRLDSINATAEAIIGGDLSHRVATRGGGDEFDRLATTLNRMLDRIEALLANLRQVSGDIAHDLRTPLTRLRQKLDLADESTSPEALRSAIADAGAQADELLALFTAILGISEVEAGNPALRFRRFDLSALIADIADSYIPAAEDGGRTLTRSVAPDIHIEGQRELVAQLFVNLLDNALRHTPPDSKIAVTLEAQAGRAMLVVADDGPGIAEPDRTRVFERFVRLDRSRTTPGHGLGLRLVAAIATAHGASIVLEDNRPGVKMMIGFERSEA